MLVVLVTNIRYVCTKMPNTKHKHFCKYIPYTAPVEFYVYAIYNINI